MSADKFKFVSPGIFLKELDQSILPTQPGAVGPVVVGRFRRGPGLQPVTVNSLSEFIDVFGEPIPGGQGGDVWRDGNLMAPTYAAYAAVAWLANNSPLTVVRLLGVHDPNKTTAAGAAAGFDFRPLKTSFAGLASFKATTGGGAYGLFVMNSSSNANTGRPASSHAEQAMLAAVFYCDSDDTVGPNLIALSGNVHGSHTANLATASNGVVISTGSVSAPGGAGEFKVVVCDAPTTAGTPANATTYTFNFNPDSEKFIRKVFNTNPTLTNSTVIPAAHTKSVWLGESFERQILDKGRCDTSKITGIGTWSDINCGFMLPLCHNIGANSTDTQWADRLVQATDSKTGWIISQDTTAMPKDGDGDPVGETFDWTPHSATRLFRFVSHFGSGEWNQNNLKISFTNIKPPTNPSLYEYGTFDIEIRRIWDNDQNKQIIEKFASCNLDPTSANYVARKIGDRFVTWNETDRRYDYHGEYSNKSKFVRIELHDALKDFGPANKALVPFGFYGPPKIKDIATGSSWTATSLPTHGITSPNDLDALGAASFILPASGAVLGIGGTHGNKSFDALHLDTIVAISGGRGVGSTGIAGGLNLTASFLVPSLPLRSSSLGTDYSDDFSDPTDVYWGVDLYRSGSNIFAPSSLDCLRLLPAGKTAVGDASSDDTEAEVSWIFSLDDLSGSVDVVSAGNFLTPGAHYASGSRTAGKSITAWSGSSFLLTSSKAGYNKFTTPLWGGFDGLNIAEPEPFRNTQWNKTTTTEQNSYSYYTLRRSIDAISDADLVDMNLAAIPGITFSKLTDYLISTCEARADSLAIIDLENDYVPNTENTQSEANRLPDVPTAVTALRDRYINSSYGCAYFPWVQIRDELSDRLVHVPPSVVALGTMAYSEKVRDLWFAPAGFTRGGLSKGAAGVPVVGVRRNLTAKDRDNLYDVNINPIASFPAEGVVVFGQKTLQVTQSALDRINVRRLLIFLKKEISRIAATTLFEQNVQATWNRFKAEVDTFLISVQAGLGVSDFKVILDETTTTPDLIDRNILYAKVFLKPVRAIEFIALDFIITDSGASFAD